MKKIISILAVFSLLLLSAVGCKSATSSDTSTVSKTESLESGDNIDTDSNGAPTDNSEGNNTGDGASVGNNASGSGNASVGGVSNGNTSGVKKTITVWGLQSNTALATAAAAYEAQNKNIKISIKNHDMCSLSELKMAIAAKNAPDVLFIDQAYAGAAGLSGYLKDLNEYGAKSQESKFEQAAWKSVQINGKQYGMPFDTSVRALLYNKDMAQAAGLTAAPKNYTEFKNFCDAIRNEYPSAYGFIHAADLDSGKNYVAFSYFQWLWRMGGEIFSANLKEATFNSKAGVDALQMLVDLKKNKQMPSSFLQDDFFNGDRKMIAMMEAGSYSYEFMFGALKKANYAAALLPVLKEGVPPYSAIGVYAYAVTSTSANPKEAYDFVSFFTTGKTYQLQYCKQFNFLPSLKEAQSDPYYSGEHWQIMFEQLKHAKYRPSVQGWDQIETYVADAVIAAMNGKAPAEALNTAATNVNKILKQYN